VKILKNTIISFFAVGVIVFSCYSIYFNSLGPCEKIKEYSIGRFDTQFGISKDDFIGYISESKSVWEKALGKDIFVYDPDASFKINLIYDERQLDTVQKQKTEFGLLAVEESLKNFDFEFNTYKIQYDEASANYEKLLKIFEENKSAYEKVVADWNSKGGAPQTEYEALENERKELSAKANSLNTETNRLNTMAKQLNALLDKRNIKAVEYNKIAKEYNQKYENGLEFNQAEYIKASNGKKEEINIYQFGSKKDLVLALTHELGHSLGLDHVENSESIMYYLTGGNTQLTPQLTAEDLAELNKVCKK